MELPCITHLSYSAISAYGLVKFQLDTFKKTSQKNSDNSLQQKFDTSVIKNNINNK